MELVPNRLYMYLEGSWDEQHEYGDVFVNLDDLYQHDRVHKHFGPPSLKIIWKHCKEIDIQMKRYRRLIYFTNNLNDNLHIEQRTLSAFLMVAYAVLRLEWDATKANNLLLQHIPARLAFFRDYHGDSSYKLNILDCMRGLVIGCRLNNWFMSYEETKFPHATNSHLDMNWIVPGLYLALKDPTVKRDKEARGISKTVVRELKRCGIKAIVRLNGNDFSTNMEYYGTSYHASEFKQLKFYHYEIPFPDVNVPTTAQANQFVRLCERFGGKIAVHCHAGLGRTATMIGCHLIKNFNFDSRSVCGWLKMCRRGSVMGPQHFFLDKYAKDLNDNNKVCENTEMTVTKSMKLNVDNTSVNSIKPQDKQTTTTRISRPPRKNNIIHIVPVKTRQTKQNNPMQKYKLDLSCETSETKRSRLASTTQKKRVSTPTERAKSTKKLLQPKVITPQPASEYNFEGSPYSNRTPIPKKPSSRNSKSKLENEVMTVYHSIPSPKVHNRANSKSNRGWSPVLMSKRTTKSQDSMRASNQYIVVGSNSWSQWGERMLEGFVSHSKNKIYHLINSVYSKNGSNENIVV